MADIKKAAEQLQAYVENLKTEAKDVEKQVDFPNLPFAFKLLLSHWDDIVFRVAVMPEAAQEKALDLLVRALLNGFLDDR